MGAANRDYMVMGDGVMGDFEWGYGRLYGLKVLNGVMGDFEAEISRGSGTRVRACLHAAVRRQALMGKGPQNTNPLLLGWFPPDPTP